MPKFRLTMEYGKRHRSKMIVISESELYPKSIHSLPQDYQASYRTNVIERHMTKWALSQLTLSYEEVKP